MDLARYAAGAGADGILFTCSAFGTAIEAAARAVPIPVLKPNEAMFRAALAAGGRVALIATFAPSIAGLEREFADMAQEAGSDVALTSHLAPGALAALQVGDTATHDALVADCAGTIGRCDAIMLAQFSTASAHAAVAARTGIPVLTSPHAAVRLLRSAIAGVQR
jgi:maleate cis-trans isomerase